ncbi:MAG TPA: VOC family protein [Candidatus Sulfotelmatobacter sp.]|nr:VOC family protein [Candidatus Sulfotelmatobacter sp.]
MLERVDRVLLAVRDRAAAAENFISLLGAAVIAERPSRQLGAVRTVLALGESEIELCQPTGAGPVARHLERWGEGLYAGGLAASNIDRLRAHLAAEKIAVVAEGGQLFLDPADCFGMPLVLSPYVPKPRRPGPVNYLYEITNTLASDWRQAAAHYARIFGLDARRFSAIGSARFGYQGTLTLFDPPARLDRIELSEAHDTNFAMGRFVAKRGDSLYMCYVDANDVPDIVARLERAGQRWTPRSKEGGPERHGLWVHPSALSGLLLGVSRRSLAWEWSGRPELVEPLAA